jgi:hypothetical protein
MNNQTPSQVSQAAFKIRDAATILGISPTSVRRLIQRGALKRCCALRHNLVSAAEIDRILHN